MNMRPWMAMCVGLMLVTPAFSKKPRPAPPPAAPAAPAVPAPAAPERVASVEGITEYRLANGLRVLLFPDSTKQTITVNVTYLVGSRHENYGETGMAHLLEHMVFKGSPRHKDIPTELSAHGARPNGTTAWDRTNYFETFAASDENLKWALDLEADRMVNSFIAQKDLDSEMTVVRNEFEGSENNPIAVLFKRLFSVAFDWHNYGNTPIGSRSDIEGVPIENLQAFYRKYYQPDNAVLLVAGKIDEPAVLKLVNDYFGNIPRPTRKLEDFHTLEPTQDGERQVALRRVGDVQWASLAYHIPSGSHEDIAALQVLNGVLGNQPAGRLHKALVESGKAAAVFPVSAQLRDPSLTGYFAQVRDGQPLDPVLAQMINIVEKPGAAPVTDEEVERARTQILKDIELALNNSETVGLWLSDWVGMGDWRMVFVHRDRLRAVKTADVQRVWATYLKPANRTAGLFYPTKTPERTEIPAAPDVAALVKDYKGDAAKAEGEAFDATPANIEARIARKKLPGSFELVLLPKKTRGGTVFASLSLRYGDVKSLTGWGDAPSFTTAMLMRGSKKHTRQQISDELDRLKARVNLNSWGSGSNVYMETTRENLPAVVALVAEILREPVFDAKELEQMRTEYLASIEQQRGEPSALAFTALSRHLSPYPPGDIRYKESVEESLARVRAVKREDLVRFHHDFFGTQGGQIAVIGDFDAAELERVLTQTLGGWIAPKPYTRVDNEYKQVGPFQETLKTPDKAQAFYVAGMNLQLRDDDPDYPALVLGDYMLGGGFLNSRLMVRLRQKDGLSYGVGSQLTSDSFAKSGGFFVYAIYAPQNLAKLEKAIQEELTRALEEGFTDEEIAAAKSGWLQGQAVSRTQDNELAGKLSHYAFLGRTVLWDADLEARIQKLDGAQIRAALRKHLKPENFAVVRAGDFKSP